MMRPRIQATISQKAYDILIEGLGEIGGPLYNRSFSRAVDTIILEWRELQDMVKKYQSQAAEYYQEINSLKAGAVSK